MNVDKTFKEIINDMRDDQDIYPKRGLSTEECSAKLLYDSLITFKNILNQSYFSFATNSIQTVTARLDTATK
jgi:murein L,D-transpeptidase YafK